jgi:hypothetical protein
MGRLSKLSYLALTSTELKELPNIFDRFPDLVHLTLDQNEISALPATMRSLGKLKVLRLKDNPLPIPPEILASEDAQGILNFYFTHVNGGARKIPLNEAKMVVVGQGGVGKTSTCQATHRAAV